MRRLQIRSRRPALLVIILALATTGALGQTTQPAPIPTPPEAIDAVQKGILASSQQDYPLAIRYFQEARAKAPASPEIFLNLGLAESNIPGRELRAICWFEAYLATNPLVQNAGVVKEEINALDVKSQANLGRLIKMLQDESAQLPQASQAANLSNIAILLAASGDLDAAGNIANVIQVPAYRSRVREVIATDEAINGDIANALTTAGTIEDPLNKARALEAIASMQADADDNWNGGGTEAGKKIFQAAQASIDLIQDRSVKDQAEVDLATAEDNACYRSPSYATAQLIKNLTLKNDVLNRFSLVDNADTRADNWVRQAEKEAAAGDMASAYKTLSFMARSDADKIPDDPEKSYRLTWIADGQTAINDFAGAQATLVAAQQSADQILSPKLRLNARTSIAQSEAINLTRAQTDAVSHSAAAPVFIRPEAAIWLAKLEDDTSNRLPDANGVIEDDCPLNSDLFLDFPHYLASLPASNVPQKIFNTQSETAWKLAKAQSVIDQMLKVAGRN